MYLKNFFFMACIFSSCVKPPAHVRSADNITKSFNERVKNEKSIVSVGCGGYFTQNKVDALYTDYEVYQSYNKDEAKELLVNLVNDFVAYTNQDREISFQ